MKTRQIAFLLRGTPSVLLALGAGFVMASSADMRAAIGMGVATLLSLVLSSLVIAAIHSFIPAYAKIPAYLLIITGFVTLISMLMEALFPIVVEMLGVHLAALSVSAVIFRDAEEVADHNGELTSLLTALVTGGFFTVVMVVCALIREVLGNASFWGIEIPFLANYKITSLAGAFGGYLVLAIVLAIINKILGLHEDASEENEEKEGK